MPLTPEIDIARLVIQLENLENRLQCGERSIKLQAEAQQLIRQTSKAIFLQKSLSVLSISPSNASNNSRSYLIS